MSTANGSPDILESGGNDSKICVLANRGDGTFDQKTPISTPADGADMTLGHFHAMPALDLAVPISGGQTNQIPALPG